MAALMTHVVSNYNEFMEANQDPLVNTWFLMSSPVPISIIAVSYLLFVLKIGPQLMKNREPFQLKNTMIWYNAIQVVFSIYLTVMAARTKFFKYVLMGTCSSRSEDGQDSDYQVSLSRVAWWYFFAKVVELLDTVFFVLRKKTNQVTFLHVYHHTITAVFSWVYLKFLPGEQGLALGFLNSGVHVVMYGYYLIAAMGPKYKKYLWWKKYMTAIQLVQFGLMLMYLVSILVTDCPLPKALTYFFASHVILFIYLFGDFYRKAYTKKAA